MTFKPLRIERAVFGEAFPAGPLKETEADMEIQINGIKLTLDRATLALTVARGQGVWAWHKAFRPHITYAGRNGAEERTVYFDQAGAISHERWETGVGGGFISHYAGFSGPAAGLAFETIVWVEYATGHVRCEWVPLSEGREPVKAVYWPGPMEFEKRKSSWYTLLNWEQGILIPNDWSTATVKVPFDGMLGTAGAYMPWFAQVKDGEGCIAIAETPWNAAYDVDHPAGGPYTHVSIRWEPSLGRMEDRRVLQYRLLSRCDHNDICKEYRAYVKEKGSLRTLREKAVRNPGVDRLIGCCFVHTGIKTKVQPDSDFYDPAAPEKNEHCTPFSVRAAEVKRLHQAGVPKLYLHLDGWAQPGYDNQHPDYGPACREAGGWSGMKELADTLHECGYLFGIHDQYRDYYRAAPSFDENFACRLPDGTIPGHHRWAGGSQSYLCGTQAPYYVKRNFKAIEAAGIRLDAAYLDVFTCNEGDECAHPWHRMTRRDCCDYRNACFEFLLSRNILSSSEEVSDWAIPSLIFCHYAPYDFMLAEPGSPKHGVPVPLFNLVYHDCVIEPWMMDRAGGREDYMLYALLNGGAPYLIRDAGYLKIDGAFGGDEGLSLEEAVRRCRVVSELHEKVAKCEMLRCDLLAEDGSVQRSVFSDGTQVTVDFAGQTYELA